MNTCSICKKIVRGKKESTAHPANLNFEEVHLLCSTKPEEIKKYEEYLKKVETKVIND